MKNTLISASSILASTSLGSITVATIPVTVTATVPAAGVAGWLGLTTTATTVISAPVTVPVLGMVVAGAALTYGGVLAYHSLKDLELGKKRDEFDKMMRPLIAHSKI